MAWDLSSQPLNIESMITSGADIWRGRNKHLDELEKLMAEAAGDPGLLAELAAITFTWARDKRRLWRHYLRAQFGIKLIGSYPRLGMRIVDRERALPTTLREATIVRDRLTDYMTLDAALWAFRHTSKEVYWARKVEEIVSRWWFEKYRILRPRRHNVGVSEASISAFLYVMRNAPIAYTSFASAGEGPPGRKRLQEAATGLLTSWVRSRVKSYESLREALREEGDYQGVLLRELPGAVLREIAELEAARSEPVSNEALLDELGKRGVHKVLLNRVANSLRTLRREANELLDNDRLEEQGAVSAYEDFELRETARQQLDALEQEAGFSPQQTEVWRRLREGKEIAEIAAELGIPKKQVSVVAHNARKRAGKARKAAGL
jgi:hypothetical protein